MNYNEYWKKLIRYTCVRCVRGCHGYGGLEHEVSMKFKFNCVDLIIFK